MSRVFAMNSSALQKCEQSEYVPSTKSDMYQVIVDSTDEVQTHP